MITVCNDVKKELTIDELKKQLDEARQEINSLKVSVRAEKLRVQISSEYTNFGLWEYDIAEDICYQYKKLGGIYENYLDPIVHFRESIIGWGNVYADDLPVFNRMCDAMERGDKEINYDVRVINDDSELAWFRYEGKTIFDDDGKPLRIVGRTLDVTAEKGGVSVATDERHDAMTGTLNIDSFHDKVAESIAGNDRYTNSAMYVISVDGYSDLRKELGEDYAEYVQQQLAKQVIACSASERGSLVAKVKNGVFALFARFSDIHHLKAIATRIIFGFANRPFHNGGNFTASIGIAIMRGGIGSAESLREAYAALRSARAKGGNGYMQYNSAMNIESIVEMTSDAANAVTKEISEVATDASKFYHLITQALRHDSNCHAFLVEAIAEAGRYAGVSRVHIVWIREDGIKHYIPWDVNGKRSYSSDMPTVLPNCDEPTLREKLKKLNGTSLALNVKGIYDKNCGFELVNGAEFAILRPIIGDGRLYGYVSFVSDDMVTWQASDENAFCVVEETLSRLYAEEYRSTNLKETMTFYNSVIENIGIEGYTIVPDTYEIEQIGRHSADRYSISEGDVCYKAFRHRDEPCPDCPVRELKEGKMRASVSQYRERENRWMSVTASVGENRNGEQRYVISAVDITDCLSQINNTDSLTGLPTFDTFNAEAMRLTAGNSDGYFMVVINVANFRRFNENESHELGDRVLICMAELLSASAGAGELVCRSEGSRFIGLYKINSVNDLYVRFNQLLVSMQKQVEERCDRELFFVLGAYEMCDERVGIMGALDRAIIAQKTIKDRAYYSSSMIAMYDDELRRQLQDRRYVETHMLEALDNDEFKVYYQPKVSVTTGAIVGAEALVRWIRPDGEIISPGRFVPVFEQNGFISDMDFAIYRHAVADIKRWMRMGVDVPMVSLNVSRHHINDDDFVTKLNALVDGLGVPHEKIELEITESMLTANLSKLVEMMTQLKASGFRISVDDFGSGYSSLNLITLLPFDTLKIDGGFFLRNELTEKNKTVISSVVTLAKSLKLETVSEGVETDEQVDFLRALGCDIIQGYYYYKPMPSADYIKLIT